MAKIRRNDPCPCGSGRKFKRCCGADRGPSGAQLAAAALDAQARAAAARLVHLSEEELGSLWEQLIDLPARSLSLLLPLPEIFTPEMQRLMQAVRQNDPEEFETALPPILHRMDTPRNRVGLARAVMALASAAQVDEALAAVELLDLADVGSESGLLSSSVVRSVLVTMGVAPTPGGLLVGGLGDLVTPRFVGGPERAAPGQPRTLSVAGSVRTP